MNALVSEGFGIVLGGGVNFVAVTAMANLAFPASILAICLGSCCFATSMLVCFCVLKRNTVPGAIMQLLTDSFGSYAGSFRLAQLSYALTGMASLALTAFALLGNTYGVNGRLYGFTATQLAAGFVAVSCALRVWAKPVLDAVNLLSSWVEMARWLLFLICMVAACYFHTGGRSGPEMFEMSSSLSSPTSAWLHVALMVVYATAGVEGLMDQVGRNGASAADVRTAMTYVVFGATVLYIAVPVCLYGFVSVEKIRHLETTENYAGLTDVMLAEGVRHLSWGSVPYIDHVVVFLVATSLLNGVTTLAAWCTDAVALIGVHDARMGWLRSDFAAGSFVAVFAALTTSSTIGAVVQSTGVLILLSQLITTAALLTRKNLLLKEHLVCGLHVFVAVGLLTISVATSTAEDLYSIPTTLFTVAVFSMLPRVV